MGSMNGLEIIPRMPSRQKKGNYYRLRTKKWLQAHGWTVENAEKRQRVVTKDRLSGEDRVLFIAKDLWGADLVAINGEEILFVQVKSNPGDIAKGMRELVRHPYPPSVRLWVVYWVPRSREPEIHEVTKEASPA